MATFTKRHSVSEPPAPPDEAPDEAPGEPPERDPDEDIPVDVSALARLGRPTDQPTWHEGYRSAMDNPLHPKHYLRDVGVTPLPLQEE